MYSVFDNFCASKKSVKEDLKELYAKLNTKVEAAFMGGRKSGPCLDRFQWVQFVPNLNYLARYQVVEGFLVEWSRVSTTGTPCLTGRIGAFRKTSSHNPGRTRAL